MKMAGIGRGIQPSSRALVKYASDPTRRKWYADPASRIASLTAGPSSQGPKNSQPGLPAIVCRLRPDVMAGDGDREDLRPRCVGHVEHR